MLIKTQIILVKSDQNIGDISKNIMAKLKKLLRIFTCTKLYSIPSL